MQKVLFDTNIILDIALKRVPHFNKALQLFKLIDQKLILGYITATTITDIYYIAKNEKGHKSAIEFITNLIEIIEVIGVDKDIIISAINSEMKDFEDAVQALAAEFNEIECLITRNKKDFAKSGQLVYTPEEFLEKQE